MVKVLFLLLSITYGFVICDGLSSVEYVGCHKVQRLENRCSLKNEDEQKGLSANITKTLAKSVEWLRQQQQTSGSWVNPHTASWIAHSLVVTGYLQDDGTCSKTLNDETKKMKSADVKGMSGGKLALLMLGLKANCGFDNKKLNKDYLADALRMKMKAFPRGEFNNFYQYSLGMIALYVNGEQILDEFGATLLRGVFIGKNKTTFNNDTRLISDTEALGLIALLAVKKERFVGHWVRKHALREEVKARKKIKYILTSGKETNFVTLLHVLQAIDIKDTPYCKDVMMDIIGKQSRLGSFDDQLLTTSYALLVLSGKSVLDLRYTQCPKKTDKVDEIKIDEYIKERQQVVTKKGGEKKEIGKIIKVIVKVMINVTVLTARNESAQVEIRERESALQALMGAWKQHSCFKFSTKKSAWGDYITHLCGLSANHTTKMYWSFLVNGVPAKVGASSYKPKENDVIMFKYIKY